MSPSWGVYSGYELYEHVPVREGSEEYLDSEKYQLRPRDYGKALADGRSLEPWLTRLNAIRRAHPALQQLRTLHFHDVSNESIIAYSKTSGSDKVVTVLTLDSYHPQEGTLWLDLPALGYAWGDRLTVRDEVTGATWEWGQANFVRLEPLHAVAHIVTILGRV
jgi:starch synthase (maltosyl-transferring)